MSGSVTATQWRRLRTEHKNLRTKYNTLKNAYDAAVDFINKHPADPDINQEQWDAWKLYLDKAKKVK